MKFHIKLACTRHELLPALESGFAKDSSLNVELVNCPKHGIDSPIQPDIIICEEDQLANKSQSNNAFYADLNHPSSTIVLSSSAKKEDNLQNHMGNPVVYHPWETGQIVRTVKNVLFNSLLDKNVTPPRRVRKPAAKKDKLVFSSSDRYIIIEPMEIINAVSSGNYTTLHLHNRKSVTVTKQLGIIMDMLPEQKFFRTHHSHIVNRDFIQTILKQSQPQVILTNGNYVPVSRRKKQSFLDWLGLV